MSGPGEVVLLSSIAGETVVRLSNFDPSHSEPKREHNDYLKDHVVAALKSGGSVGILGIASRSGSPEYNLILSQQRANAVIKKLWELLRGRRPLVTYNVGLGENYAALMKCPDGKESGEWRGVILSYWARPNPPPPPVPPPPPEKPQLVHRYRRKDVQMPEDPKGGAFWWQFLGSIAAPDSITTEFDPFLVSSEFGLTKITMEHKDDKQPWMGPVPSVNKRIEFRFDWGPRLPRVPVVWYAKRSLGEGPERENEIVSQDRALEIYEHPGAYVFRPHKVEK